MTDTASLAAKLAGNIRAARDKAGLTQRAVAEHLGLSRTVYTALEGNQRAVTAIEVTRLAALFDLCPCILLPTGSCCGQAAPPPEDTPEDTPGDRLGDTAPVT